MVCLAAETPFSRIFASGVEGAAGSDKSGPIQGLREIACKPVGSTLIHLYSVSAITDAAGAVVERYGYDAYGESVVTDAGGTPIAGNVSTVGNPYRFTGRRLDRETGLSYFRFRYYNEEVGRFINRDPIGYVDGLSMYRAYFVPIALDPYGLSSECGECEKQDGTKTVTERYGFCWLRTREVEVPNCVPDHEKIMAHAQGYASCIETAASRKDVLLAQADELYWAWKSETERQIAELMAKCKPACRDSVLGQDVCTAICESRIGILAGKQRANNLVAYRTILLGISSWYWQRVEECKDRYPCRDGVP